MNEHTQKLWDESVGVKRIVDKNNVITVVFCVHTLLS